MSETALENEAHPETANGSGAPNVEADGIAPKKLRCPECLYDRPSLHMLRPEQRCPNCGHTWAVCEACKEEPPIENSTYCRGCSDGLLLPDLNIER